MNELIYLVSIYRGLEYNYMIKALALCEWSLGVELISTTETTKSTCWLHGRCSTKV